MQGGYSLMEIPRLSPFARGCVWVVVGSVLLCLVAWQRFAPLPATVAAQVNGSSIPVAALDVFVRAAQLRDPHLTPENILYGLIENRLLAATDSAASIPSTESTVGYDFDTQRELQSFALIRTSFSAPLAHDLLQLGAQSGLDFLVQPLNLQVDQLAPMLRLQQSLTHALTPAQQRAAQQFVIAHYQFGFDQPVQKLTLWELYRRQNIQLKVHLHNLNLAFMKQAINQYLGVQFVLHWFATSSGLDHHSQQSVLQYIDDALIREQLLAEWGVMREQHDDNPALTRAAASVSNDEIERYYVQHLHEFQHVNRVHAQHIRLHSQADADTVYEHLQAGMQFQEAAQRFSSASDAAAGGVLGWIARADRHSDWLRALAFVQPQGQFSKPVRSPAQGGDYTWEIVHVDAREVTPQPLASETVRCRAARAVAREKLAQQFQDWLTAAKAGAQVRINQVALARLAHAG